jgi:hypothetical protein
MKKGNLSAFFLALGGAIFVSLAAYLFWQPEREIVIDIEGHYENPFDVLSFEDILQRLPGSIPILQYHMIMTPHNASLLSPLIRGGVSPKMEDKGTNYILTLHRIISLFFSHFFNSVFNMLPLKCSRLKAGAKVRAFPVLSRLWWKFFEDFLHYPGR